METTERESEKLPDMPALRQEEMVSTERDLGPSVPTILVIAGKKLCDGIHPQGRNQSRILRVVANRGNLKKAKDDAAAYGLGWLEDGGHPDGLLEQKVGGMHRAPAVVSSRSRFGSDREGERGSCWRGRRGEERATQRRDSFCSSAPSSLLLILQEKKKESKRKEKASSAVDARCGCGWRVRCS